MLTSRSIGRRILDTWAQETGYSSFEVYLAAGGNVIDAKRDIEHRIGRMGAALEALRQYHGALPEMPKPTEPYPPAEPRDLTTDDKPWPEVLAMLEAEDTGEPVDPGNAHVEGEQLC